MSAATFCRSGKPLIGRLPDDQHHELIEISREASFSHTYQQVFDDHPHVFTYLVKQDATAAAIGQMLAEVGIVRKDGSALPAGTVSSALAPANEHAPQHRAGAPAWRCMSRHEHAGLCKCSAWPR
jgi:hypothetical protein